MVREYDDKHEVGSAVSGSVGYIADHIDAKLVIAFTETGRCARRISRTRHPQTIIALSPNNQTLHNLNFSWGVHPKHIHSTSHFDNMREQAKEFAKKNGITELESGEPFVIAAGMPFGTTGSTNMVYVEKA
jgi:pyruvate kinase